MKNLKFSNKMKDIIVETIKNTAPEELSTSLQNILSTNNSANEQNLILLNEKDVTDYGEPEDAELDEIIYVDDDTFVEFYRSGVFIVNRTFEVTDNSNDVLIPAAVRTNTITLRSQADAYNVFGYIIVSVWAEGYFSYDGINTPKPTLLEANYEKYGILNAWGVDNWQSYTVENDSAQNAKFIASGNFYWGLTWEGNGWKIENYAITVGHFCNKKGETSNLVEGFSS